MSGICGILALDGRPVEEGEIQRLLAPLKRRGPDGAHVWRSEHVALGHTLLATTPEALIEKLPLTHSDTDCTITADARIDNRSELLEALGLSQDARVVGDAELILRAYLLWGEECPTRLLGDFAFAIWDPRRRRLFCARDQMGMRQLIYSHQQGRLFVFASEPSTVVLHPRIPRQINEERLIDYLEDLEAADLNSTFFRDVFRLPPAHRMCVDQNGVHLSPYWHLEPGEELHLNSDGAYCEAFLAVFRDAIESRLRSTGKLGAMLSGGIDSGSVCAISARLLADRRAEPLLTVSAIGPDPDTCSETRASLIMGRMPGLNPKQINHAELAPLFAELSRLMEDAEEPFDHMPIISAVYLTAKANGVNVMLDGVGGDNNLSCEKLVRKYLYEGRFGDAVREARGWERVSCGEYPAWKDLLFAAGQVNAPTWLKTARRFVRARIKDVAQEKDSLVHPDFAQAYGMAARKRALEDLCGNKAKVLSERAFALSHPRLTVARERYDRVASRMAIEPRDPFCDLRLRRFIMTLPAEQLEHHGWPKLILRRSMQGVLPEEIIWKRGRHHLGPKFSQALHQSRADDDTRLRGLELLQDVVIRGALTESGPTLAMPKSVARWQRINYLDDWLPRNLG